MEEKRIYVVVAGTIQVSANHYIHNGKPTPKYDGHLKTVVQPLGRQFAQGCHVVSKLRLEGTPVSLTEINHDVNTITHRHEFTAITTITLQARDSAEMGHVFRLLHRKKLNPVIFSDTNPEYGPGEWPTAIAVLATKKQTIGILDYLPMWGK